MNWDEAACHVAQSSPPVLSVPDQDKSLIGDVLTSPSVNIVPLSEAIEFIPSDGVRFISDDDESLPPDFVVSTYIVPK